MSIIDAVESSTGHNRTEERNVAKILYAALIVAAVLGFIFFFSLGHKKSLNPTHPEMQNQKAPATPSNQ